MIYIEKITVPKQDTKTRLTDLSIGLFKTIPSKKSLKKAIKNKRIFINENIGFSGDFLFGGEVVSIAEDTVRSNKPVYKFKIDVLFENESFAVVLKPAGLSTSGNPFRNLENCLPSNLLKSNKRDALIRPLVIHRLDFATSGIVIVGKTQSATINLNKQFEVRTVKKKYLAVTLGVMPKETTVNSPIDSKSSQTNFTVIASLESTKYKSINLVEAEPITGRRHQIRKHLLSIGHPICGDNLYNNQAMDLKGNGLYLHAYSVSFLDPDTEKEVSFSTDVPKKIKKLFQ